MFKVSCRLNDMNSVIGKKVLAFEVIFSVHGP